jgi:hypothetical protein
MSHSGAMLGGDAWPRRATHRDAHAGERVGGAGPLLVRRDARDDLGIAIGGKFIFMPPFVF